MRTVAFTLMLLGCALALAQTVYKWTDENGVVHYSDQPHANAEKIKVQSAQTYKAQPGAAAPTSSEPASSAQSYRGCAIVQPGADESFANIDSLTIVVQTDPPLRPGDRVYVTLDGAGINNGNPTGAQFNLSPVERGQHTLQAVVRGGDGTVMCQTPGISFNVQQNTLLNPNNPNNRVVAPR